MSLESLPDTGRLTMGDQITDSPDELLVKVFKMMPPEHRANLRRVSQKFNNIICDAGVEATGGDPRW
jgi:hypothetical protein